MGDEDVPGIGKAIPLATILFVVIPTTVSVADGSLDLIKSRWGALLAGIVGVSVGTWIGSAWYRSKVKVAWLGLLTATKTRIESRIDEEIHRRAADLVYRLHSKCFRLGADLDVDYRVSLFLLVTTADPMKPEWVCYGRTGAQPLGNAKRWPHETDPDKFGNAGLVVWTKIQGFGWAEVEGLPEQDRRDDTKRYQYRARCRISEADWEARSWKYATFGLHAARREGRVPFVLVIERESGRPIEPTDDVDLEAEVQHAGEYWCSPQGDAYAPLRD